jgi:putative sterol carrier protein
VIKEGEEGGYKELVLHLKHDTEYTHRRIKELAQARELSPNPRLHKQFERFLAE